MTKYVGLKSLDAEITLDFLTKNIVMDYSLNKLGSDADSNSSVTLRNELDQKCFEEKVYYCVRSIILGSIYSVFVTVAMPIMTALSHFELLTSAKWHIWYQTTLKKLAISVSGVMIQRHDGELKDTKLQFRISNNLFFEYKLEGDYQDKVSKISLTRRIVTEKMFGEFIKERQRGWYVTFEFTEPPTNGSCEIQST